MDGSFGNMTWTFPFPSKKCVAFGAGFRERHPKKQGGRRMPKINSIQNTCYLGGFTSRSKIDGLQMPKRGVTKGPIETMRGLCHGYFSIIGCIWIAKNSEGWNHLKYRTSIWNCISWPFHARNLLLTAPKSLPLMPGRGHLQVASIGVKVSPTKYPFLIFSGSFFGVPN